MRQELERAVPKLHGTVIPVRGDGYWCDGPCDTTVDRIEVFETEPDELGPELFMKVHLKDWRSGRDGLVYGDNLWIKTLRERLREAGFSRARQVNYTEQGMQGEDYVHLIVGMW